MPSTPVVIRRFQEQVKDLQTQLEWEQRKGIGTLSPLLQKEGGVMDEVVVDKKCNCDRCQNRTTETYRLRATCLNCFFRFVVEQRKGDRNPLVLECPSCEVSGTMSWSPLNEF